MSLEGFPLSQQQESLWRTREGSALHRVVCMAETHRRFNLELLQSAIERVVEKHEILRTSFHLQEDTGRPLQVVMAGGSFNFDVINLNDEEAAPSRRAELFREHLRRQYRIDAPSALCVSVVTGGHGPDALILSLPTICADSRSMPVIVKDIEEAYTGQAGEGGHEETVQYVDYAHLQNELQAEQATSADGREAPRAKNPTLPGEVGNGKEPIALPDSMPVELPEHIYNELEAVVAEHGISLQALTLCCLQVIISRFSGDYEPVIRVRVDRRPLMAFETAVGPFATWQELSTTTRIQTPFVDALLATHRRLQTIHEQVGVIAPTVEPGEGHATARTLPVSFEFDDIAGGSSGEALLRVEHVEGHAEPFKLKLSCVRAHAGLAIYLHYNQEQLKRETASTIASSLRTLLSAVPVNLNRPISRLPILDEVELSRLLQSFNDTQREWGSDPRAEELFEQHATRHPEAVAVAHGGHAVSYGELERQANQLAQHLSEQGLKPEDVLAIYLERSVDVFVCMLAAFKAGAAFVCLDPAQPAQYVTSILSDTRPAMVVTTGDLRASDAPDGIKFIYLDKERSAIEACAQVKPRRALYSDQLAYIVYTSGTTGRPRGTMLTHKGLVNLSRAADIRPPARIAQLSSLNFDAYIYETFLALLNGAALVLVDRTDLQPVQLRKLFKEFQINLLTIVPSLLRLLDPETLNAHGTLTVHSVGEACSSELAERWSRSCRFFNAYGPAEATVCTHKWEVTPRGVQADEIVPIGHPLPNVYSYILDAFLNPVPVGVTGELYIGGVGVGRGYLNMPGLTAEKFVPDPFTHTPGRRLYRSGDLARYRADGAVEFVGRVDSQIKIRGMRVEATEIERVLESHAGVSQAAVVAQGEISGSRRMAAFIIEDRSYPMPEVDLAHEARWAETIDNLDYESAYPDDEFNIAGWKSSYTGEAVPEVEMREFVDSAVRRIMTLNPQRVLDIGCGTGLLLFKIAPLCKEYRAGDFSGLAIDQVCKRLSMPPWIPNVKTMHRRAADFSGIDARSFDTAILNSVIQYFPSENYLTKLIGDLTERITDGGHIFIGDVRHLPLLRAFHCAVQLENAPADTPLTQLSEAIDAAAANEAELVLSPLYFYGLTEQFDRIRDVRILPKRGEFPNEFNCFRYDVVLRVGDAPTPRMKPVRLHWSQDRLSLTRLRELLATGSYEQLVVRGVPNARVARAVAALRMLPTMQPEATVAGLRGQLYEHDAEGIDPNELYALADEFPYRVEVSWAEGSPDGSLAVAFIADGSSVADASIDFLEDGAAAKAYESLGQHLSNSPTRKYRAAELVKELRAYLGDRLPKELTPSSFVVLEEFPVLPSGKIDRAALSTRAQASVTRRAQGGGKTPVEQVIADVWCNLLEVSKIGVNDNFFELGGHSLLAVQAISRINRLLRTSLPVRSIFQAPTATKLAEKIGGLRKKDIAAELESMRPSLAQRETPLSFSQKRLWFIDQLSPNNPVYNMPVQVLLRGNLDVDSLARSLAAVGQRHDALRTRIVEVDGELAQVVDCEAFSSLPLYDLHLLAPLEKERQKEHWIADFTFQPFDLATGPLTRATLLQLEADEYILLLTAHHIIADGWSLRVLLREVTTLYEGFIEGLTPALPELPIQYADYAQWQNQWLAGPDAATQLAYWQQQLANLNVLELPADHPRPPVQMFRGATEFIDIRSSTASALKSLGMESEATFFMSLLAAFKILLFRYTGQEDIVVGTPIANRNRLVIENLIGSFANNLVLRTELSGEISFRDVLNRIRQGALDAYDNQDYPFEKLVEELRPRRDLSRSPLMQIWFAYFNVGLENAVLPGLELEELEVGAPGAKFDLSLSITETGGRLRCAWEYNTDLFEAATIRRMAQHFLTLLQSICEHPGTPIAALTMFDASETTRLMLGGPTEQSLPLDYECVHVKFEEWAARTPDAVAIRAGGNVLTYAELNERVRVLARRLQQKGVSRGDRVAICLNRGLEMVASILAVLKVGAAYVPLDPLYPAARLRFTLEDSRASVLITEQGAAAGLPTDGIQVLLADDADDSQFSSNEDAPLPEVGAADLAYVIYTSGSEGKPKGVQIAHGSVANVVNSIGQTIGADDTLVMLSCSSISFDVAGLELFLPLTTGGQLAVADAADTSDGERLAALLLESKPSVMQATPTQWRVLLAADWCGDTQLTALCGGEPLTRELASELRSKSCRLFNLYGPTETTIWSTMDCIADEGGAISIGTPVARTFCYVLDSYLRPVPAGVLGELYISGEGLAWGYVNRPGSTAEVFLPDPFSLTSGARMYRTGDMARYQMDGRLYLLGRRDAQVKLRGYRIELPEIERTLESHPDIQQAALLLLEEEAGGAKGLVAFYTTRGSGFAYAEELQTYLSTKLPAYMIPGSFVPLNSFPRTPNGKLDTRSLAAIKRPRVTEHRNYVAPRTELEGQIARIWAYVLGHARVGVQTDFFDELGGHSMLVPQVISMVRYAYHVKLPLRSLFEVRTVAAFAEHVEEARRSSPIQIQPVSRISAPPISFSQAHIYAQHQETGQSQTLTLTLRLSGSLDLQPLVQALVALVQRHETLRTSFFVKDGTTVQTIRSEARLEMPFEDLSVLSDDERARLIDEKLVEHESLPFDLINAPLLKVSLLRPAEDEHLLHLSTHRIVADSWSMKVLVRDLFAFYEDFSLARQPRLTDVTLHYADFGCWQRTWLGGDVPKSQLAARVKALKALAPLELSVELPAGRTGGGTNIRNAQHSLSLSGEVVAQLNRLSEQVGVPLSATLLAAFMALLQRYSSGQSPAVGCPVANRNWPGLEASVGPFVNALVVRTDFTEATPWRELIRSVHNSILEAMFYQDIPVEKLIEQVYPDITAGYNSLFRASFIYQVEEDDIASLAAGGLKVTPLKSNLNNYHSDFALRVRPQSDGMTMTFDYNLAVLYPDTARLMLENLAALLKAGAAEPDESIGKLFG
jgi:pristinamycin I synthase-3/4